MEALREDLRRLVVEARRASPIVAGHDGEEDEDRGDPPTKEEGDEVKLEVEAPDLPAEVWRAVLSWLPPRDLATSSLVCKRWADLTTRDDSFWHSLCRREFGEGVWKPEGCSWLWRYRSKKVEVDKLPNKKTFTGVGRLVTAGYHVYEGDLVEGKLRGFGVKEWTALSTYVGQFYNDRPFGKGRMMWANGGSYVGDWACGDQHGFGERSFSNGDKYRGTWYFGDRKGYGEYTWSAGHKYAGMWDKVHEGEGEYFWPDGRKYQGEWKEGKKEGHGVYSWPDGCVYVGSWKSGYRHGSGEMKWADGTRFEGMWKEDIRGEGKCFDAEGYDVPVFPWGSKSYDEFFNMPVDEWEARYGSSRT